jgi:hypothetical protein
VRADRAGKWPYAGVGATQGWADVARQPVGFIIPIHNSGSAPAVIDAVEVIAGTRYDTPHVIALRILTRSDCGGAWPARQTSRGFELSGCGGPDSGPLIGHAVAAAVVAAPRRAACWVMTKIVVHYHVGISTTALRIPTSLLSAPTTRWSTPQWRQLKLPANGSPAAIEVILSARLAVVCTSRGSLTGCAHTDQPVLADICGAM